MAASFWRIERVDALLGLFELWLKQAAERLWQVAERMQVDRLRLSWFLRICS
jgi:hypothetical protein